MKQRSVLALLLSLALMGSLLPAQALAAAGGPGALCTCTTLCAEGGVEQACPVCGAEGAGLSQCAGAKPAVDPAPDAGGGESGDEPDEPGGESVPEQAVRDVQAQINALPTAESLAAMSPAERQAACDQTRVAYDAYTALTEEQKEQITGADAFDALFAAFDRLTEAADAVALEGNGTEGSPYQIADADDLITFRNIVNNTLTEAERAAGYAADPSAWAKLTADIDLNPGYTFQQDGTYTYSGEGAAPDLRRWTPIGSQSRPYTGTFDGNGKTVRGVYINTTAGYQGLFGYVGNDTGNNGTVKNLTVGNSCIRGGYVVGGVVGAIGGPNNSVVHCSNTGIVSGTGVGAMISPAGGVVGSVMANSSVENCHNSGVIHGDNAGGVVGQLSNSSIQGCRNEGAVTGDYAGGVAGGICSDTSSRTATTRAPSPARRAMPAAWRPTSPVLRSQTAPTAA